MRIIKDADERKNEILDVANELFRQRGFDSTSISDIIEKVGIARGTLYYHFRSKEDIMDALIGRSTDYILNKAQKIATDDSLSVTECMMQVVISLNISDSSGKELIEHIHRPQNALMHQKIQKAILDGVTPILTKIAKEGIKQGLFKTPFPYECMEMAMTYANTVFDDDNRLAMTDEEHTTRIKAFVYNMERLLGAKSGSFMFMMQVFDNKLGDNND